jgi:hypothetical protein
VDGDVAMTRSIEGCVLCGAETGDRVMAIVEWTEPIGHERWTNIPRCVDRAACRHTVEVVLGEPWPVADGTPPPVRPMPDPSSMPPAEAPAPVATSAVEEILPWMR